ncbi:alpha/beta fold hydrolase [Mycolicibacterium stellerae]|uniref:alpha/beta fold hydrolase n=1 Tax=Mycolicibacterium stellerae TaxID=2358193 RepID=UPI0019CFBC5A|nr:alpha/beta hydrolase [Mycolicibacterium stellerae]
MSQPPDLAERDPAAGAPAGGNRVPVPPTPMWNSRFIEVDGIRTHYLEAGDGPPLVLLHSGEYGGCAEFSWEYILPGLAEHHRVIAPDWLGFGKTDKIHDFGGKRARMLSHMRRFLAVMAIDRADFLGNSMGATWLTQEVAANPARLPADRIVVISGAGFVPDNEYRRKTLEFDCTMESMSGLVSALFVDDVWHTDTEYVRRRYEMSIAPGAWESVAAARFKSPLIPARSDFGQPDTTVYENLKVPTLLIAGLEDRLREPGYARVLAERIPDSRLVEIPDCGHCANIERPERVLTAVQEFFAERNPK